MVATAEDWKRLPFKNVRLVPYAREFSPDQFERLRLGLLPQAMEDKWFIYFEEPYLYFHRSWTGQAVYRVKVRSSPAGHAVEEAVCALEVIQHDGLDYEAELLDFLTANLLLGEARPFPKPAGLKEPHAGLYQHVTAGTGYAERVVGRRPWWKFWS